MPLMESRLNVEASWYGFRITTWKANEAMLRNGKFAGIQQIDEAESETRWSKEFILKHSAKDGFLIGFIDW